MFPKDKQRQDSWVQAIRRVKSKFEKWSPSKYSYVDLLGSTVNDFTILFITYTNNANQNILAKINFYMLIFTSHSYYINVSS